MLRSRLQTRGPAAGGAVLPYPHLRRLVALVASSSIALAAAVASPSTPPGFGQGSIGGYYSFDEVVALLDHYASQYPLIVAPKVQIGQSVEGRPLWAIKVSDHPAVAEDEPRVLIDALHHAREPTSMQAAILLLDGLVTGYGVDPSSTALVDSREIWFVPIVNPDGYVFNQQTNPSGGGLWRKNRATSTNGCVGVDLNRNYSFQWGVDDLGSSGDPCSDAYRGPTPLSEPESAAMHAFAASQGFDVVVSLHAHGRKLLYPFGYAATPDPWANEYANLAGLLVASNGYVAGPVHEVLGLANGNALDHHHAVLGARAWTYELGGTFWPTVPEMIEDCERNLESLRLLVGSAGAYLTLPDTQVVEVIGDGDGHVEPGESGGLALSILNVGIDPAINVKVSIASTDPLVQIAPSSVTLGLVPPWQATSTPSAALPFSVSAAAPLGHVAELRIRLEVGGVVTEMPIAVDIGQPRTLLRDDCEVDLGWSLSEPTDDAMTGRWVLADPTLVVQDGEVAQPEYDATPSPGKRCFVTGNNGAAPGMDDVDSGVTTLTTPLFDLTHALAPQVGYQRFYWCSNGDDAFDVEISNDGGQTYTKLESVIGRPNDWRARRFRVSDFVAPTSTMRVRFVARDPTNNSVTEALIDGWQILDFGVDPHLITAGTPRVGKPFELQLAAPQGQAWILASAGPGSLHVPGVAGTLGLNPTALVWVAQVAIPTDGLLRLPIDVPPTPSLAGGTAWVQALTFSPSPAWSNEVSLAIAP